MKTSTYRVTAYAVLSVTVAILAAGVGPAAAKKPTDPPVVTLPVLGISDVPLFLGGVLDANFMLTLDDSASMGWAYFPDSVDLEDFGRTGPWGLASRVNSLAYDPRVTYSPPAEASGQRLPDVSFGSAPADGYQAAAASGSGAGACVTNLGSAYRATWTTANPCTDNSSIAFHQESETAGAQAFYYVYYADDVSTQPVPAGCDPSSATAVTTAACYLRKTVGTSEQTNFANWYSYYRTRMLATKGALGAALASLSTTSRVGFARVCATQTTVPPNRTVVLPIRTLVGTWRSDLFSALYGTAVADGTGTAACGTPLRRAADDVGQYFKEDQPWRRDPADSATPILSCRQSYHFLVSDGVWSNGANDGAAVANGNEDGSAQEPFKDDYVGTLADVAWYYWKNDLRATDTNDVPPSANDPATWQHLVTFALGLGLQDGTISPEDAFAAVGTETDVAWPDPFANPQARVDDFLHAAVNGHGEFMNLTHPFDLSSAMSNAVRAGAGGGVSSASVVLNSGALRDDTRLYQVRFRSELGTNTSPNPSSWTGQLLAYAVNSDGTVGQVLWDAATLIPSANSRVIATKVGASKIAFTSANAATINLTGQQIEYLRGVEPGQSSNGFAVPSGWRERSTPLGDIVNSAPAYVGPPTAPYLATWCADVDNQGNCVAAPEDAVPYPAWRQGLINSPRPPVIYLGANDGMLHAFNADSGVEMFAYIPSVVVQRLTSLTAQPLGHRYFVDGSPTVGDSFFGGDWHTILAAGLNAGGQAIFALDITRPEGITTEATLGTKVLWEFTDTDDRDLGFTYSRPNIVRLNNNAWAVVFGNGFNNTFTDSLDTTVSSTGNAVLYIVNAQTGALIKKIDTGVGSAQDPTGAGNRPNGLATVAPVDLDGDFVADLVYAGDLFGNLWKFDLRGTNTNGWGVSGPSGGPLFSTPTESVCNTVKGQSITTRLEVVRHPQGGQLVLLGTGSYFQTGDATSDCQATQAMYGIWDSYENTGSQYVASAKVTVNDLLEQTIDGEASKDGSVYRVTSNNQLTWRSSSASTGKLGWYMKLKLKTATANLGERQVSDSEVRGSRLIFTTLLPQADVCDFGGDGWLMELDATTGARPSYAPFYAFKDGVYSLVEVLGDHDGNPNTVDALTVPSGRKSHVGIVPTPAILARSSGEREYKYMSGSTGAIDVVVENPGPTELGRRSWEQLFRD